MVEHGNKCARYVYEIDMEDIEVLDEDFHAWLLKQDDDTQARVISAYAEEMNDLLNYYIENMDDGRWACLEHAKCAIDYKED